MGEGRWVHLHEFSETFFKPHFRGKLLPNGGMAVHVTLAVHGIFFVTVKDDKITALKRDVVMAGIHPGF
jgi:hypothetical protein